MHSLFMASRELPVAIFAIISGKGLELIFLQSFHHPKEKKVNLRTKDKQEVFSVQCKDLCTEYHVHCADNADMSDSLH